MFENQVRRLVETFAPPNASDIEVDRTIRKTARLLSSNTQYQRQDSYENLVQRISQSINQNDKNSHEKSLYFLEIAQRLQSSPHLVKKSELLQMLDSLSQHKRGGAHSDLMSYRQSNRANMSRSFLH